uniref:Uncharacterized protein n=1 Tax=Arundo donax TaxID=35708 RepID=A0A0A9DKX3_ARUDO
MHLIPELNKDKSRQEFCCSSIKLEGDSIAVLEPFTDLLRNNSKNLCLSFALAFLSPNEPCTRCKGRPLLATLSFWLTTDFLIGSIEEDRPKTGLTGLLVQSLAVFTVPFCSRLRT